MNEVSWYTRYVEQESILSATFIMHATNNLLNTVTSLDPRAGKEYR